MIFYFSATGNSKYVASRIAEASEDKIISITECVQTGNYIFPVKENEKVGIVAPVYFWGLPTIISEFLDKLTLNPKKEPYIYYVTTYGTTTGQTSKFADKIFIKKNYTIQAYFSVKMPDTWTPIFDLSDKNKVAHINEQAEAEIEQMIRQIRNKNQGDFMARKMPSVFVKAWYPYYETARKTTHFRVEDTCIGCHLCEKKCPVQAIQLKNGKPLWIKDKCVLCLGCLHHCPKFAIQYGKYTKKHGQYKHPYINV